MLLRYGLCHLCLGVIDVACWLGKWYEFTYVYYIIPGVVEAWHKVLANMRLFTTTKFGIGKLLLSELLLRAY